MSLVVPLRNGERVLFVAVNDMDVWESARDCSAYTILAGANYKVDDGGTVTIGVGMKPGELGASTTDIRVRRDGGVWSIAPGQVDGVAAKPDRDSLLQFGDIWAAAKNNLQWTPPADRLGGRESCVGPRDYTYRSQLETKWAHVFDEFGWSWEYEPFVLKGYIPDFVLTFPGCKVLVEVKGGGHNLDDPEFAKKFVRKIERSGWHGPWVILGDGKLEYAHRAMSSCSIEQWSIVGLCGFSNPSDDERHFDRSYEEHNVHEGWDAVVIRRHLQNGEWSFGGASGVYDLGMNPVIETEGYYRGTYMGGDTYLVKEFLEYWDTTPFYYTRKPMKWPRLCELPKRRRGVHARRLKR